ncbi:hypothetical protein R1sor_004315 [Riccia sorocarpa]|uniref:DUF1990 domain-containing protein n=1 Tax=Riccia sorocarpa TaxID=122646 RepID=A0ABD3HMP5_9MARC
MWIPRLWLKRPSAQEEKSFLSSCQGYNYDEKYVGATAEAPWCADRLDQLKRDGFTINHTRVKVGAGTHAFERAKDKLQNWRHLQLGWASVDPTTPIKVGGKFGIVVHELVAWLVNPLQIAYLSDGKEDHTTSLSMIEPRNEMKPVKSRASQAFAFGGGTLRGHLLAGEERFAVEWNEEDDSVWYEILSFSKPAHFLTVAGFPILRYQQKLFAKQSSEAMIREVNNDMPLKG